MPNLEICSLSLNKIQSLKDFSTCKKLAELYLRKNLIQELLEVKCLNQCPQLKVLWLQDNPIAEHPLYRQYIIKLLPNLLKLDSAAVTPEEKQQVAQTNFTDLDIINNNPIQSQKSKHVDDQAYHQKQERPRSVNPLIKSKADFINPSQQMQQPQQQQQQMNIQSQNQSNLQSQPNHRNENILCAVLALLKELDENGLELVKRDVEKKIQLKKMDSVEKLESTLKSQQLLPGDLILIRTPSSIYEAFRRLGESYYDHIAVVLDDQLSLHISYPRTKVVPTILFTHKKKQPLIIRPNYKSDQQREQFLQTIQKMSMGKQYDYYRIIQVLISQSLFETKKYEDNSTNKIICSHQIYLALSQTMKTINDQVSRSNDYEVHKLGTFTLSDFIKLAQKNPKDFDCFSLYSLDELKENSDTNLNFEGVEITLNEDKQIGKIESVMKLIGMTKLKDLIERYEVLQVVSLKSLHLAQKLVMMRKQIVLAITVLKMIQIIVNSYRDYQQTNKNLQKDKSSLKKILEILSLLTQILVVMQDSKETLSTKILKPLTKLILVTYTGGKEDFKLKTLKIANFVLTLQEKIKSTFKL
ncbi:leucine rich repeat family protein [Stylonychia lemnae]|uniref:Leucine rich repeat family protein n=1 Tax=Stylonychia lemnae TaxID=5949 RepID=A0A077ZY26_STYLE|nr:leucine rich repeat family protein [Stylonychia lemnae]|eukprot:CDW74132.1 leucine rich repeat family protein [Stylonychia lemnae]